MKRLALMAMGLAACGGSSTQHLYIDRQRDVDAIAMAPASLPDDPAGLPEAERVWLVRADGTRSPAPVGPIHRDGGALVFGPIDSGERYPIDDVRAVVFERDAVTELSRRSESVTDKPTPNLALQLAIATVAVTGLVSYLVWYGETMRSYNDAFRTLATTP